MNFKWIAIHYLVAVSYLILFKGTISFTKFVLKDYKEKFKGYTPSKGDKLSIYFNFIGKALFSILVICVLYSRILFNPDADLSDAENLFFLLTLFIIPIIVLMIIDFFDKLKLKE